ncbi:MAG: type IV pilus assembly protein PilM [Candidatus Paceibacterota bacterium]|jgi:type IV pilus assembly protein PilM
MDNPFKKVFGSLNLNFTPKSQSVVGIDIGSSFVKVVQLKKKGGKAVLETYGELALGPIAGLDVGRMTNLSEEKIAQAVADIFREANVTTKECAIAIPLSGSLISFVEIPYLVEKQLQEIIPIEARKYIPVPISEVTLDWWIIPKFDSATTEVSEPEKSSSAPTAKVQKADVLIVAIHNEVLSRLKGVALRNDLKPGFFEIEVFSTVRSTFGHDLAPTMLFDMGAGMTKLSIVERGVMQSSHTINRGSQDITLNISNSLGVSSSRAEELKRLYGLSQTQTEEGKVVAEISSTVLEYVFSEANRILLNYERKYGKSVSKIILIGGGVLLKGFREVAAKNLEAEVSYGDPFSKVEAPAFLTEVLQEAGPEFAVAIGLALRRLQELD